MKQKKQLSIAIGVVLGILFLMSNIDLFKSMLSQQTIPFYAWFYILPMMLLIISFLLDLSTLIKIIAVGGLIYNDVFSISQLLNLPNEIKTIQIPSVIEVLIVFAFATAIYISLLIGLWLLNKQNKMSLNIFLITMILSLIRTFLFMIIKPLLSIFLYTYQTPFMMILWDVLIASGYFIFSILVYLWAKQHLKQNEKLVQSNNQTNEA